MEKCAVIRRAPWLFCLVCASLPRSKKNLPRRARSKREGTLLSDNVRQVECWFYQIDNLRGSELTLYAY
jgi:hypothetical protein